VADSTRAGRAYTGEGVDVYFDAQRCLHFAECVRGLPAVFDVKQRPWIQPANAGADEIAEVVRAALCRCGQTENGPYCDNACRR
jgi:uncharacterized Fe-S cluster protein YjdI